MNLLVSMNECEYIKYVQDKTQRYADTLNENTFEITNESAFVRAKKVMNGYLPNGFYTKDHEFFCVRENGNVLGFVWIKIVRETKSAFLYEIFLKDQYRSSGIGKKVMTELEALLSIRDIKYFKLHVFGNNSHAINLYNQLGFQIAGINMYKEIVK